MGRGGVHFALRVTRVAKLLAEVDQAGMDWSPIRGPASEAVPIAVARFTSVVRALSDDQRTITSADVLYDDQPEDAATGTWYDYVTHAQRAGVRRWQSGSAYAVFGFDSQLLCQGW